MDHRALIKVYLDLGLYGDETLSKFHVFFESTDFYTLTKYIKDTINSDKEE